MSPVRKRWFLIGGALAMVALVTAAAVILTSGSPPAQGGQSAAPAAEPQPSDMATYYLRAFASGDAAAAGALTDDPAAATAALTDARKGLTPAKVFAKLSKVDVPAGDAPKTFGAYHVTWTLAANQSWDYDATMDLVRDGKKWLVHWAPTLLHPKLETGQHLLVRTTGTQPSVVDRDGKALVGGDAGTSNPVPLLAAALKSVAAEHNSGGGGGLSVARTDADGKPLETLFGSDGSDAKPLASTLSLATQSAAQAAVDGAGGSAVMIAMQPSSGDILAVAQNSAAGGQLKVFSGQYAPGSTFKIVTATGAMETGVGADDSLDCPGSALIGQRRISNENSFSFPPIPMHTAFAHSCNTTFAQLAADLPADGLAHAANQLGINADFTIPGVPSEAGKVAAAQSSAEQVEDGIGQGVVHVSPFGEVLMAATVASGKAVTPKLWQDVKTQVGAGYKPPPASVLGPLRSMMREVVTGGTATGLKSSGTVFGKTGTAQFGDGKQANGWFVGYRGDLAFAVLLEGANSSTPAVTVSAKFLAGLH